MDQFVLDCTGENNLLNQNKHYNAPATITSSAFLDKTITTSSTASINNSTAACLNNKSQAATSTENDYETDEDDSIDDQDYYGDIPINSIDISEFIELPPKPPKDPMLIRIEKFCQELKCPVEDIFTRQILTDVEKEMQESDTMAQERKTLENLSLKMRKKLGKVCIE